MKTCPNCNLYFNDGYSCPQCGGVLWDADAQAGYQQDPMLQGQYPATAGYDPAYMQPTQGYPQQAYDQPYAQQAYQQQPYAQQPYAQPEPAYAQPEPAYAMPAYEPEPEMPQAPAKPIVKVVQKPSRGKTAVIIILAILAAALAGVCAFLALNDGGDDPDGLEQAVVSSAWTWQSSVSSMLDEMEDIYAPFAANGQETAQADGAETPVAPDANAATADSVSEAEDAEASADTAEAEADAAAQAEADAQTELDAEAEDAEASVDAAAANDEADAALAEAEAMVEAAEDMTATAEGADAAALSQSLEDMGEAMGQLIGYSIALSALANEEQIQILDGPMQALREDHPDLVTAWDNLKGVVSGFITENLQDEENEAQGSSSAAAASDQAAAQPADATTPDAAAQSDSATAPDMAAWEEFLNNFRVARDGFQQRAIEASFTLA